MAGCGQCVSELHQGIFHCVNLLDTVYQEEKLTFFSSLKKVRAINEKLEKEISSHQKAAEMMLNNEAEIITMEFEEIFKNLEMKKKQLLEDLENQRSKKEKELQIWKKMKGIHKITIENFLKDCEKLVDECDPQCFLEVACGLNKRMKTQLDLMHIASSYEKEPEYTRKQMDIKSVVKEILALQLTPVEHCIVKADLPSGGNESLPGNFVFKNSVKHWKDQKTIHKTFYPVAGQEETFTDGGGICTRLMSISGMLAFQNMSPEELRYKYYMGHRKTSDQNKDESEKIKLGSDKTCPDEEAPMPPVCKLAVSELSPKDLSVKGGKTCSIPGAAATQSQMELKVADDSSVVVANKLEKGESQACATENKVQETFLQGENVMAKAVYSET
ncbi:hypothetical protein Y1Q_0021763 [Alligator mississippiensis]|uniref:Uncharacterized protein n=1 Tax=Alligator mississippiensis TaxID=8496 RepID=A0A151PAV3_ALLMI|nr:hypothetical protein Y1Q_0021763 [Alligator mississippiensis]